MQFLKQDPRHPAKAKYIRDTNPSLHSSTFEWLITHDFPVLNSILKYKKALGTKSTTITLPLAQTVDFGNQFPPLLGFDTEIVLVTRDFATHGFFFPPNFASSGPPVDCMCLLPHGIFSKKATKITLSKFSSQYGNVIPGLERKREG